MTDRKRKPCWREITADEARRIFSYDPETGVLRWEVPLANVVKKGTPCACKNSSGYYTVGIYGKMHTVHRIIWLMMTGSFPDATIDHINRDRSDNRWSNLRPATISQQRGNTGAARSKTGVRGVVRMGKKYQAKIKMKDPTTGLSSVHCLGTYPTLEQAGAAYDAAALRYYGEFYQPSQVSK